MTISADDMYAFFSLVSLKLISHFVFHFHALRLFMAHAAEMLLRVGVWIYGPPKTYVNQMLYTTGDMTFINIELFFRSRLFDFVCFGQKALARSTWTGSRSVGSKTVRYNTRSTSRRLIESFYIVGISHPINSTSFQLPSVVAVSRNSQFPSQFQVN